MHKGRQRHANPRPGQKNYHAQPSSNFCLCVARTRIKEFLPLPLMLCVHPFPHSLPSVSSPCSVSPCLCPVGPDPCVLSHLLWHFCVGSQAPTGGFLPTMTNAGCVSGCPVQRFCIQRLCVCAERWVMSSVLSLFICCVKAEFRATSSQVPQGKSSRSSSLGPGGTLPLARQGTDLTPLCL